MDAKQQISFDSTKLSEASVEKLNQHMKCIFEDNDCQDSLELEDKLVNPKMDTPKGNFDTVYHKSR